MSSQDKNRQKQGKRWMVGRTVHERTKADELASELRVAGYWIERLHSGVISTGRLLYDLESRGLPQLVLPALHGFLMVTAGGGAMTTAQASWLEKAHKHGTRIAVVNNLEEALKAIESWNSTTS